MMRSFLETSCMVTVLGVVYERYCQLERWLGVTYKNSEMYRVTKSFYDKVIVAFRYSFLGGITEVGDSNGNSTIIDNSKVVGSVMNFYNKWKVRLSDYSGTSSVVSSAMKFKRDLHSLPLRTGGMVVFVAVLTNILLFLFLRKEIGIFGWSMRGVFLFVAFWGMFCEVGWEELKKTSRLVKWVEKGSTSA